MARTVREKRTTKPPATRPSLPSLPAAADPLVWVWLAIVLACWAAGVGGDLLRTSHWAHHVWLADAFLHGRLHLMPAPPAIGDLARVGEHYHVVFGPLPAVPLLPLVAAFGLRAPDILVLVLTALAGVWAFHRLMVTLHPAAKALAACATLTFALGTAMHYGPPMGGVWLQTQVTATALQCAALLAAAQGRAWTCGALLALTVLARPNVVLAAPLAWWLLGERHAARRRAAIALPLLTACVLLGAYNAARFGDPLDAGYLHQLISPRLAERIREHGQFSLAFAVENLVRTLFLTPLWVNSRPVPDGHGMSVLITTPWMLFAFWSRAWTPLERVAGGTALLLAVPALLYYNDGSWQFGQRFALDWIVPALVVASFGARRAPLPMVVALTLWGAVVGAWGLQWMQATFPR